MGSSSEDFLTTPPISRLIVGIGQDVETFGSW